MKDKRMQEALEKTEGKQNLEVTKWLELYDLCKKHNTPFEAINYLVNYYINSLQWGELKAVEYAIKLFENGTIKQIQELVK